MDETLHTQDQVTLRTCPFCDGKAEFDYPYPKHYERDGTFLGGVWIKCKECPCELGRGGWDSQENDMGVYSSFESAAEDWNRRAHKVNKNETS